MEATITAGELREKAGLIPHILFVMRKGRKIHRARCGTVVRSKHPTDIKASPHCDSDYWYKGTEVSKKSDKAEIEYGMLCRVCFKRLLKNVRP